MSTELSMGGAGHLSEDELDEVLVGGGSPAAEAHLAQCAACASRKVEFAEAVAGFNQATLAWSEAKSHGLTRELVAVGMPSRVRFGLAGAGVCAVALVGMMLGTGVPWGSEAGVRPAVSQGAALAREIDGDNAMLQAIDAELYRPVQSPEQIYQIDGARRTGERPAGAEVRE